jgi:cob(I)alamin adenosyltransferase
VPKIYTKTGDDGETSLFDGTRVDKSDPRVDTYGDVDELNAFLGLVRANAPGADQTRSRCQQERGNLTAPL